MTYSWPAGMLVKPIITWPGEFTRNRRRSNFGSNWGQTLEVLRRELRQLSAKAVVLQVAIPENQFRIDGYPRATAKADHPGIILSMDTSVGPLSYPCDTFDRWEDNLRGIALALEALRKVDRYGVTKRGEQYQGFKALPPGIVTAPPMTRDTAFEVLRRHGDGSFRKAQRNTHPDHGGDASDFDRVMQAGRLLGYVA